MFDDFLLFNQTNSVIYFFLFCSAYNLEQSLSKSLFVCLHRDPIFSEDFPAKMSKFVLQPVWLRLGHRQNKDRSIQKTTRGRKERSKREKYRYTSRNDTKGSRNCKTTWQDSSRCLEGERQIGSRGRKRTRSTGLTARSTGSERSHPTIDQHINSGRCCRCHCCSWSWRWSWSCEYLVGNSGELMCPMRS